MNTVKPKQPLIAVLLSCLVIGLGHWYADQQQKGGVLFAIYMGLNGLVLFIFYQLVNPEFNLIHNYFLLELLCVAILMVFDVYVYVDAYKAAKEYNNMHTVPFNTSFGANLLIIIGIVIALMIPSLGSMTYFFYRANVAQPFKIVSGGMNPTFQERDRVYVDKRSYKSKLPEHGDVIIFNYPKDPTKPFIQRVVGLPGDTVEIRNGGVYVNGQKSSHPIISTLHYVNRGNYAQMNKPVRVPEGQLYILGDHSITSNDSRIWGFLPKQNIVGKVVKIYWPPERAGVVQ